MIIYSILFYSIIFYSLVSILEKIGDFGGSVSCEREFSFGRKWWYLRNSKLELCRSCCYEL